MKTLITLFITLITSFSLYTQNTVVDIIVNSHDHDTLETAVLAADLAGTLSGDGPFTVFAPTDAAFALLPEGTLDTLLKDPGGMLTEILTYHVVTDNIPSTSLMDGQMATTLLGKDVSVSISHDSIFINNALVTVADIHADNGIVHVIDAVLIPASNTVVDIIVNSEDHDTLEAAVLAADLAGNLSGEGPFTVFAPTDAAFALLPAGTIDTLLADPSGQLTDILLYHVIDGDVRSTDLMDGQMATTLLGKDVNVTIRNDSVFINNALVTAVDIVADNGVVHVIDAVLLPPTTTVVDIVVNSMDHDTLEAAILAADLAGTLSGDGPFTVFAPTDAAFALLPAGTIDTLLADPSGQLTDILLYHVINGDVRSTDLMDGQMATTLLGKDVNVTIRNDSVFINNALVTAADIVADNGVVHVIDAVLLPPTTTVVDIVVNSMDHDTLEAAILAADLAGTLSGDGPFTVFAPTDAAFALLPAGTIDTLLADPSGQLTDILLYHVINGDVRSTDLMDGQMATTLLGKDVNVTIRNDSVFINNALVTAADIVADNGVVHVIDAVLLPPTTTVVDIVVNSMDHDTLEAAILAADLAGTLSGDGPFTVFAPTDAAFALLPAGTIDTLLADPSGQLTDILLYHVINGDVRSTDLMDGQMATTLLGKDVNVTIRNDSVFINNALVTAADIVADNGVVHVIDAVLLPPTTTVVDIVVNSMDHDTLEAAILAADLAGTLSGDGPFTVFAPTDAAFALLPAGTIDTLLADPSGQLTQILLYHVIDGDVRSTDLMDGQMATTLLGKDVNVTIRNDSVFINNALVTVADIVADNGVVHVIDAVLLPPTTTVVDVIVNSPDHETLEAAVLAADLAGTFSGDGPYTVFAPTDAAFMTLPEGTLDTLLADPSGQLRDILLYHVINANVRSTDLVDGQTATTLLGQDVNVSIRNDSVFINNAWVTTADIETDNGVVHVIDAVLIPSTTTSVELLTDEDVQLNVYPNPVSEFLTIDLMKEVNTFDQWRIWSMQGNKMVEGKITDEMLRVNTQSLMPGNYLVQLIGANRSYQKIILVN